MYKILHIDDEELIREFLSDLLKALFPGAEVSSYETWYEAALELEQGNRFDLILLDEVMPDIQGNEIFEIIKQRYPDSVDRVVFVTGSTLDRKRARPTLKKPFGVEQLKELVEPILNQVRQ